MKYRNNKGRYITKKQHEKRILFPFKVYATAFILMIAIGIIAETNAVEYVAPHFIETHTAEAHTMTEQELCELHVVECEDEEPVQRAISAVSEALGREVTDETKKRIKYLYERATEHSVPFYDAVSTVFCESMWISQKSLLPEESYGLAQIHLPSHPNISREQAMDAYFALDFLVENWAGVAWFGYDRDTGDCANNLTINL